MGKRHICLGLFFLSGFCGLLYQIIWVRLAFGHFGITTAILSVVVSVFMLGLGLGSWGSGILVANKKCTQRFPPLVLYALAELGIGLSAFLVPLLFATGAHLLLKIGEMNSLSYTAASGFFIALSILPWCILMGATLPLMLSYLESETQANRSSFGEFYFANVMGAGTGVLLTAGILVELFGFRKTLFLAGVINAVIASVALLMAKYSQPSSLALKTKSPARISKFSIFPTDQNSILILGFLFVTGFVSMALEVVWVRAFTIVLKTTIYSFAIILFAYLMGTVAGSGLYADHKSTGKTISTASLLGFLALSSLIPVVFNDSRFHMNPLFVLLSLLPLCAGLGYLTPKLIDEYSAGSSGAVGLAYAVNVIGCVLGPLFASYLFLPFINTRISLVLLALPFFAAPWVFKAFRGSFAGVYAAGTGFLLLWATFITVGYEEGFKFLFPTTEIRRDSTATVISGGSGMQRCLYVNGIGITLLTTTTKMMAHIPLARLAHPPKSALVICFGMGTTFRSLMSWGINVTAVELVPSVKKAFPYYFQDAHQILNDPKGKVEIDDGRRYLARVSDKYDVITIDPPPPLEAAGSSLLYSMEFYEAIKPHLSEGGILQQWIPTGEDLIVQAMLQSLIRSFPYVTITGSLDGLGVHISASMTPLPEKTAHEMASALPDRAKKDLAEWMENPTEDIFEMILSQQWPTEIYPTEDSVVTDDQPFNEYFFYRRTLKKFFTPTDTTSNI